LGKGDAQIAMYHSVVRMLLRQLPPQQFSIVELSRSHELRSLESEIVLSMQRKDSAGQEQKGQNQIVEPTC
jgi:hypothetical protein